MKKFSPVLIGIFWILSGIFSQLSWSAESADDMMQRHLQEIGSINRRHNTQAKELYKKYTKQLDDFYSNNAPFPSGYFETFTHLENQRRHQMWSLSNKHVDERVRVFPAQVQDKILQLTGGKSLPDLNRLAEQEKQKGTRGSGSSPGSASVPPTSNHSSSSRSPSGGSSYSPPSSPQGPIVKDVFKKQLDFTTKKKQQPSTESTTPQGQ